METNAEAGSAAAVAKDARALLEGVAAGLPDEAEALLRDAITRLREVSRANGQDARTSLETVMKTLGAALDTLRVAHDDADVQSATQTVAKAMAILYPAQRELERIHGKRESQMPPRLRRESRASKDASERRRAPRVAVEADIGFQSDTNFFTGFSGDISEGGLFVATYADIAVGTELTISFVLPNGHQVTATGSVRWIREAAHIGQDDVVSPGVGIRFSTLSGEDKAAIDAFIAERNPLFYDE